MGVHTRVCTTCGQRGGRAGEGDAAVDAAVDESDERDEQAQCDCCLIRLVSSVTWL